MKKLIILAVLGILLTGCLPQKPDETKTVGQPDFTPPPAATEAEVTNESLEAINTEADKLELENFDQDLNSLDADINQL
jgi:hypothetical protein